MMRFLIYIVFSLRALNGCSTQLRAKLVAKIVENGLITTLPIISVHWTSLKHSVCWASFDGPVGGHRGQLHLDDLALASGCALHEHHGPVLHGVPHHEAGVPVVRLGEDHPEPGAHGLLLPAPVSLLSRLVYAPAHPVLGCGWP